ncbi:MAG: glycosyltransferase family 4 protein [Nitrospiraceae bacterium]|nr:glycosyltransferase family 4 protein [Nitrospiraceae bacterium]
MKILHFLYDHTGNPWVGGGGAVRAEEINKRLAARHKITVISGMYPGAKDYITHEGISYIFLGSSRNNYIASTFCYAAKAAAYLRKKADEADIIIEDFAPWNPVFSFIGIKKPVILQLHHKEASLFSRFFVFGLPFAALQGIYPRFFKNIITVSKRTAEHFALKNAAIISNGIDEALLKMNQPEEDYVLFIGRLHMFNKGLDILLDAAPDINTKILIAGKGPDEEKIRKTIKEKGLGEKVLLTGFLSETQKRDALARAKLFVLPSRYEGQGIVVLEAAACGKPVVVNDIPELRFAVENRFGLAFKKDAPQALACQVNKLLDDQSARSQMAANGRAFAAGYTWEKITGEFERYLIKAATLCAG